MIARIENGSIEGSKNQCDICNNYFEDCFFEVRDPMKNPLEMLPDSLISLKRILIMTTFYDPMICAFSR